MDKTRLSAGYEIGSASDAGRKRKGEPNQDSVDMVLPSDAENFPPLLVVADGMGGHLGGVEASNLVVKAFREHYLQARHPANYLQLLAVCADMAHKAVRDHGSQDQNLMSMGSTVVAVVLEDKRISLINVGDSRAYLFRGKKIIQISQDQSWVEDQVRAGILTAAEARGHPKRNRLSMSITAKRPSIAPYSKGYDLEPADIILLCSDGLWGSVPETLIWAAATELEPQAAADKLVALANANRGPDNISIIIARRFIKDRKNVPGSMEDTNPGI
jgi:serine/threonine protein phosphatase PrpC